jgi:hypothetical protein
MRKMSNWQAFWIGAAQVIDMGGTMSRPFWRRTASDDGDALYGDWCAIGRDMARAMNAVSEDVRNNRDFETGTDQEASS